MTQTKDTNLFDILRGWKIWDVYIMNNYYDGRYSNYSPRAYYIIASSKEEAKQVVLDNADDILADILTKKLYSGRKLLSKAKALLITDKRIGAIDDGTVRSRLITMKPKEFFTPDGVKTLQIRNGWIEE